MVADVFRDLDEETRQNFRASSSTDSAFAEALRQSRVVLGETGLPSAMPHPDVPPSTVAVATLGADPRPFLLNFPGLLRNLPILDKAAAGRGLFSIRSERDGIVRRVPLIMLAQGDIKPALTFDMLRVVTGAIRSSSSRTSPACAAWRFRDSNCPPTGTASCGFICAPRSGAVRFGQRCSRRPVGPEHVGRKLVLIGTSAAGLLDLKTTPVDPSMPGVEVHAQILESMLTKSMLSAPNYAIGAELCAALLIGASIIWIAPVLSPFFLLAFGALIGAVVVGTSWYYYTQEKLLIDSPIRCCPAF